MPAAVPFIPQIISGASAGIGALLGKKGKSATKPYVPNPAYTQPLAQAGSSLLPMAQQGFQKAFDYYGGVLSDPAAATASDAASIGRQSQQALQQLGRQPQRGGASQYAASQIPQQAMTAGLERRLSAQQGAAGSLGQIAGQAGGLGTNIFGNLLGNELGGQQVGVGQGYLDLARTRENRDYYGGIGGSIFDTIMGKGRAGDKAEEGSIMDRLGGWLGRIGKGKRQDETAWF
jgi:hypothetical protein